VVSPYPHPYFVSKFLVFLSFWVWLRRKIVTIKKFPAKSSRIRSYVEGRGSKTATEIRRGSDVFLYCAPKRGNSRQARKSRFVRSQAPEREASPSHGPGCPLIAGRLTNSAPGPPGGSTGDCSVLNRFPRPPEISCRCRTGYERENCTIA